MPIARFTRRVRVVACRDNTIGGGSQRGHPYGHPYGRTRYCWQEFPMLLKGHPTAYTLTRYNCGDDPRRFTYLRPVVLGQWLGEVGITKDPHSSTTRGGANCGRLRGPGTTHPIRGATLHSRSHVAGPHVTRAATTLYLVLGAV